MWTVILIPLAIPLAIIGAAMMLAAPFVKTEKVSCPSCGQTNVIEKSVQVYICDHCQKPAKRNAQGWMPV
ncbi:MAG: hypothetical protein ACM3ZA_01005 [Bacillota bacterium]